MFDYPDPGLSGLFTEVPTSPDNRGSTVTITNITTIRITTLFSIIYDFSRNVTSLSFPKISFCIFSYDKTVIQN